MDAEQFRSLTATEREVLRRLAAGNRPVEIAQQLSRSISTINNHLQSARIKLSVSDSLTAARAFVHHEADGQRMPRHALPMEADPGRAPRPPQQPWAQPLVEAPDARRLVEPPQAGDNRAAGREQGRAIDDLLGSKRRTLATIVALTLVVVALIALAPAMAATFQILIDRLYPIHR